MPRAELLCGAHGDCAPLDKTHRYLPPLAPDIAQITRVIMQRQPLLDEMRLLQFPLDGKDHAGRWVNKTCMREGRVAAAYNAGLASTYHGIVLQLKRALRDRVPISISLGGFKQYRTRSGKATFIPRDGRSFYYGCCASGSLDCVFQPHTRCTDTLSKYASRVKPLVSDDPTFQVTAPEHRYTYPMRLADEDPGWVPDVFDGSTFAFISTVAGFYWRLTPAIKNAVQKLRSQMPLPGRQYIGAHIRRGDSCFGGYDDLKKMAKGLRQCLSIPLYTAAIDKMSKTYPSLQHVLVASDDPSAMPALQTALPHLTFVGVPSASRNSTPPSSSRQKLPPLIETQLAAMDATSEELRQTTIEVIATVELLADAAVHVGALSSQMFRLAFELAYYRNKRVGPFESLDTTWCFAGSWGWANVTLARTGGKVLPWWC